MAKADLTVAILKAGELNEVLGRLERIERKLDMLLLDAGFESETCPHCGSDQVQDTSTATVQRFTCLSCGRSTPSEEEALSG